MIKIEFSWIYQMQLGVWCAVVSLIKDLGGEALRNFFEIYTSNGLKINARLPIFNLIFKMHYYVNNTKKFSCFKLFMQLIPKDLTT